MSALHTPGPWRWEFNQKHKSVALVGGKPQFDLTVMDFERWGMHGAVPRMRDTAIGGMNIMHKVCDRADWIAPLPGREHHADWCAGLTQPDLRLIAAAPDLLAALKTFVHPYQQDCRLTDMERMDAARAAIARATGAA